MTGSRRGRPRKALLATLREPGRAEYQQLVSAALAALIEGERDADVLIAIPYVFKFPADFPKGVFVEARGDVDIRRVKAKKLLGWLRGRGHTTITTSDLHGAIISSGKALAAFDEMCEFEQQEGEQQ